MRPGKGIQEAPGGRIIQFDSVDDKSSCCGEHKKFGEDDSPSTHCLVVNTCCVMSSPTEQGAFISANLVSISKIKKILRADVFFRLHLSWAAPLLLATSQRAQVPLYRSLAQATQQFLRLEASSRSQATL